jgi:glycosyltransferase involved in cell wall biosynthesis
MESKQAAGPQQMLEPAGELAGEAVRLPVVAFATHHWRPERHQSGVVSYAANIVEGMRQLGARVYIVANQVGPTGVELDAAEEYVRLVPRWDQICGPWRRIWAGLERRVQPDYAAIWTMSRRLLYVINDLYRNAHIELFETEESCGVAGLMAPHCPVPVVLRLHGPWFMVGPATGAPLDASFEHRVRREGLAMSRAAAISVPSWDVLERVETFYGVRPDRCVVIPNPVKLVPPELQWSRRTCEPAHLLFVGRFDRAKGVDVLLGAFGRVLREYPDARLTIVGADSGMRDPECPPDGAFVRAASTSEREFEGVGEQGSLGGASGVETRPDATPARTAPTAARLSAPDYIARVFPEPRMRSRVEWLGMCSTERIAELRRIANVAVVASRYESFSMVTLEAMAAGMPVVAPNVGGIPELIKDGRNGLLFRAGDDAELADRIMQFLQQPGTAEAVGRQAAEDAAGDYSPVTIARRTLEFHREVIDRAHREKSRTRLSLRVRRRDDHFHRA